MIPLLAFALGACLAVEATQDQIVAGDLARELPEWAAVPPETGVAIAPAPGVQRVMRFPELRRLAARFSVTGEPTREPCFTLPAAAISPDRMLAVMREQLPDARIAIVEPSRIPAPNGVLEFPMSGLRGGYWFGRITYGAAHHFVVWARVDVTIPIQRIVATVDLKTGEPIDPHNLRMESTWGRPPAYLCPTVAELAGLIPRRAIAAGAPVDKQYLDLPKLIQRGDSVKVEVIAGGAHLSLDAIAETSGGLGDLISIQNPDSKRRFRARVEAKGHVSVKGTL
jgi:flagellar basal body P-ring formation protein FlgA